MIFPSILPLSCLAVVASFGATDASIKWTNKKLRGNNNNNNNNNSRALLSIEEEECKGRVNNTTEKLLECITVDGVSRHLAKWDEIMNTYNASRVWDSTVYNESAKYVRETLTAEGYSVVYQEFNNTQYKLNSTPVLIKKTNPDDPADAFVYEQDFNVFHYWGSGNITAFTQGVDIVNATNNSSDTSTSGCEPEDFANFVPGRIAVIQRGSCLFSQKIQNAINASAVAVILFNEGQPDRQDLLRGRASPPASGKLVPVLGASYETGITLAGDGNTEVNLFVDGMIVSTPTFNVIAESELGDPSNVVMVGAHLDAVEGSHGGNDNGSGSAAILEVAIQMAMVEPVNKVRFVWWGAEEEGLVGSKFFIENLSDEDLEAIQLYLNFDMVGSSNFFIGIMDGRVDEDAPAPNGTENVIALFEEYFSDRGIPHAPSRSGCRNDACPFLLVGVPSSGIFTGAEQNKTQEQEALFGGTAGEPYDPCYHRPCDTFANISLEALAINSRAVAYATLHSVMSADSVTSNTHRGGEKRQGMDLLEPESIQNYEEWPEYWPEY